MVQILIDIEVQSKATESVEGVSTDERCVSLLLGMNVRWRIDTFAFTVHDRRGFSWNEDEPTTALDVNCRSVWSIQSRIDLEFGEEKSRQVYSIVSLVMLCTQFVKLVASPAERFDRCCYFWHHRSFQSIYHWYSSTVYSKSVVLFVKVQSIIPIGCSLEPMMIHSARAHPSGEKQRMHTKSDMSNSLKSA
jgi:hypothetical protein